MLTWHTSLLESNSNGERLWLKSPDTDTNFSAAVQWLDGLVLHLLTQFFKPLLGRTRPWAETPDIGAEVVKPDPGASCKASLMVGSMRRVWVLRHQTGAQYSAVQRTRARVAVRNVVAPACFFSVTDQNVFKMTEQIKSFRSECFKI